jgi:hypothetical protein
MSSRSRSTWAKSSANSHAQCEDDDVRCIAPVRDPIPVADSPSSKVRVAEPLLSELVRSRGSRKVACLKTIPCGQEPPLLEHREVGPSQGGALAHRRPPGGRAQAKRRISSTKTVTNQQLPRYFAAFPTVLARSVGKKSREAGAAYRRAVLRRPGRVVSAHSHAFKAGPTAGLA